MFFEYNEIRKSMTQAGMFSTPTHSKLIDFLSITNQPKFAPLSSKLQVYIVAWSKPYLMISFIVFYMLKFPQRESV